MKNKYFFPAYIYGILILISSSLNPERLEKIQESNNFFDIILSDYSLHFFAYGAFAAFLFYGFYKIKRFPIPFVRIGLYSTAYGLFIEIYQIALPYRAFNIKDLISDIVGITAFLVIIRVFILKRVMN
ncbi:MAG: VanZ family protein [Candidatus Aminicenantes bacterium]|nr:VanZ family protein [Candidatus Aminicenantes bacterium]